MTINCLLCNNEHTKFIDIIQVSDLALHYKKMLGSSIINEFDRHREIKFLECANCDLRFFWPPITGSERFYKLLQKFEWYYLDDKSEYDFACCYINEADKVLDIGCGKGAFAKKIKSTDYTGLEFSLEASSLAEKHGIKVLNEYIEEHALKHSNYYDVVCSFQVLEHVANPADFLSNSIKCLKSGGLLIISVPAADSFISKTTNGLLNMPPHHVTWWSDKTLQSVAGLFPLEVVEIEPELLADIHKHWYASTVATTAVNRILKRTPKLLDTTIANKFITKLVAILGRIYILGIEDTKMRPRGHSITVVYKKLRD